MNHPAHFPAQYGARARWTECTVDQWGVWRCNGMYMPAPSADRIQ